MKLFRRLRLVVIPACFCVISICPALFSQQPPASQPPAQPQTQTPPATPPKPSPFETIPAEQQPAPAPAPTAAPVPPPAAQQAPSPQLETPKQEAAPAFSLTSENVPSPLLRKRWSGSPFNPLGPQFTGTPRKVQYVSETPLSPPVGRLLRSKCT